MSDTVDRDAEIERLRRELNFATAMLESATNECDELREALRDFIARWPT